MMQKAARDYIFVIMTKKDSANKDFCAIFCCINRVPGNVCQIRMLSIYSTQSKFTIGLKNSSMSLSFLNQVYFNSYKNMSLNKFSITDISSWFQNIHGLTCHFAD